MDLNIFIVPILIILLAIKSSAEEELNSLLASPGPAEEDVVYGIELNSALGIYSTISTTILNGGATISENQVLANLAKDDSSPGNQKEKDMGVDDEDAEWRNKTKWSTTTIVNYYDELSTLKPFEEGNQFVFMNATCSEAEDPNCVIDHNITCVGDPLYCNLTYEEYLDLLYDYIYPTVPEWILISSHVVVFVMGLVGNALVCIAVYTNHSMRTVTNIFIVNLAVADFFVILLCLPPTVVWDVTETWFMGKALCKVVIYFQNVSVTVSVLTLTFISIDRWYAICFPLRYVSTNERAICSIAFIWLVALLSDIPEFLALTTTHKELRFGIRLFTQCQTRWDKETEKNFYIARVMMLYVLPLLLMTVAYFQIVRVLWKSDTIPGHRESRNHQQYTCTYLRNPCPPANSSTMGQLRTRRKAAKMLVAVVIMFAGCFFPVHCLNVLRYTIDMGQDQVITILSLFSHWLCYANSAINPVIYNFMSGKFRREFKNALEKCRCVGTSRGRVEDRSMYHSAPATRFNNISPSSRSNYQLASMRDFTRQQTIQTSFIENGNGNQRLLNHNAANDVNRRSSNPYLNEPPADGQAKSAGGSNNLSNGHSGNVNANGSGGVGGGGGAGPP